MGIRKNENFYTLPIEPHKIKLYKQFICDFTVTKDDLLGCDKGQILFIQFTPSNDGKMSGLYIHGGILERTDIEIKMK